MKFSKVIVFKLIFPVNLNKCNPHKMSNKLPSLRYQCTNYIKVAINLENLNQLTKSKVTIITKIFSIKRTKKHFIQS